MEDLGFARNSFVFVALVITASIFSGLDSAHAQKSMHSDLMWQPRGNSLSVQGGYKYQYLVDEREISSVNRKDERRGQSFLLGFDWGMINYVSFGVSGEFEQANSDVTSSGTTTAFEFSGLADPEAYLSFVIPFLRMNFYFGSSYFLSSSDIELNTTTNAGNVTEGTNVIAPFTALQFRMGNFWIGLRGEWRLYEARQLVQDGAAVSSTVGGDELDVIANLEYNWGKGSFGMAIGANLTQKSTETDLSDSSTTVRQSFSQNKGVVYFRFMTGRVSWLGRVDYLNGEDQELSSTENILKREEITGSLQLRYVF